MAIKRNLTIVAASVLALVVMSATNFAAATPNTSQVVPTHGGSVGIPGGEIELNPQVLTFRSGGYSSKQYFAAQTDAFSFSAPVSSWVNVPSTTITVNVPSGTRRLINARFNGESLCTGAGWCSLRIVYKPYSSGSPTEFFPQSGSDYAWDTPGGSWETGSIERSTDYLPAGNYHVWIQAQLVGGSSPSLRLDDYHLAIEMVNP